MGLGPVAVIPRMRVQPIAAESAASVLVSVAEAGPTAVHEIAGPARRTWWTWPGTSTAVVPSIRGAADHPGRRWSRDQRRGAPECYSNKARTQFRRLAYVGGGTDQRGGAMPVRISNARTQFQRLHGQHTDLCGRRSRAYRSNPVSTATRSWVRSVIAARKPSRPSPDDLTRRTASDRRGRTASPMTTHRPVVPGGPESDLQVPGEQARLQTEPGR